MIRFALAAAAAALAATPASAALCPKWSAPEKAGALDMASLNNASGLAASRAFPGRLYHHNDAGAGGKFYVTDLMGGNLKTVVIEGYSPPDLEDLALGPCAGTRGTCLYLGDFGDNAGNRKTVTFAMLPEKRDYAATEKARIITAQYPDGAHNAEGMAVYPNGDLYVITKVGRGEAKTRLFKLTAAQLKAKGDAVLTFADAGGFELTPLMPAAPAQAAPALGGPGRGGGGPRTPTVTAMTIPKDGKGAIVLTYSGALELAFDLSKPLPPQAQWVAGKDYAAISTGSLPQAEGIAYSVDGKSIYYTSEYMNGGAESVIMKQTCVR